MSHLIGIRYDAYGEKSVRRITMQRITNHENGNIYINSYCHEARAPRMFILSNVEEIFDAKTGETLAKGAQVISFFKRNFMTKLPVTFTKDYTSSRKAINACRYEAYVLAGLAWCDGEFHEKEQDVIFSYIEKRGNVLEHNIDKEYLSKWVGKLYPDGDTFHKSIKMVARKFYDSPHKAKDFKNTLELLITADGFVKKIEVDLMKMISLFYKKMEEEEKKSRNEIDWEEIVRRAY